MRAALFSSAVVALCAVPVLSASAQSPATKPDQPVRIIVGCLVQGLPPAAANEQRSEAAAAHAKDFFVRTPTVQVPPGTSVAVGKPGTTSTATSAGKPTHDSFYRITGLAADQLKPHVGHRVELQGHLAASDSEATATTARTTPNPSGGGTTTAETRDLVAGVLHATTLKMVSASCD